MIVNSIKNQRLSVLSAFKNTFETASSVINNQRIKLFHYHFCNKNISIGFREAYKIYAGW